MDPAKSLTLEAEVSNPR